MRLRNYALVTLGYWAFTVTDGALRMLVLLHFHDLGYSPVSLAFLFLLYEFFGIVTNLLGGWAGARAGLNRTLVAGLGLQVVALLVLSVQQESWIEWLSVVYVMGAQALSGIAKDLTKMSSKSAVKFVAADSALFRWVAILTGSKNALKGVGFFVGAALLSWIGFAPSLVAMATALAIVLVAVLVLLDEDIGRSTRKPPLRTAFSKSPAINRLAATRFFLFGARDIWFVVALPVFLDEELGWSFEAIGAFLAAWVIGYGIVQSAAPTLVRGDHRRAAVWGAIALAVIAACIGTAVSVDVATTSAVVGGLVMFGVVFALNSSLHSFLILAYSQGEDDWAMDVGFYYSANAAGRLAGTLLSGLLYLAGGIEAALFGAAGFLIACWALSLALPETEPTSPAPA